MHLKQLLVFCLALSSLSLTSDAAEALLNSLPNPPGTFKLGSESDTSGANAAGNFGSNNFHWNPGFHTASSASNIYVAGSAYRNVNYYIYGFPFTFTYRDGFITKMDPRGRVAGSWSMDALTGSAAHWQINDIATYGDLIFVCGKLEDGRAFVAKLTDDGNGPVINDYTIITPNLLEIPNVTKVASANANSIAISLVGGVPRVVVAGDIAGASMSVSERQLTNPGTTFKDLVLRCRSGNSVYSDAWVLRLDDSLHCLWGTTLGHEWSADAATAVAADNTGAIFLALKLEDPRRNGGAVMSNLDDDRKVVTDTNGASLIPQGGVMNDYTFTGNYTSQSLILRLDPNYAADDASGNAVKSLVTSYFTTTKVEVVEDQSHTRITDLAYANGVLYAAGEWKKVLRPLAHFQEALGGADMPLSLANSGAYTSDIWVAKLDPTLLNHSKWQLFQSAGDDYVNELTVTGDGVFLTGSAGSTLTHRDTLTRSGTGDSIPIESSSPHLFWAKLGTDLAYSWSVIPYSGGSLSIPAVQRISGIGVVGNTVVPVGAWDGGSLTMGTATNGKTFPDPAQQAGFAAFLNIDGTYKEGLKLNIKSDYGSPLPARGITTVISGDSVNAKVQDIVYEDAAGNIINSENSDDVNKNAVTRRICTGYQFKGSDVNGTINEVSFVVTADMDLTFNWRTEHAVEVESNLTGTEGLTSSAAGNPDPAVQKHWIRENDQFTAFIDGAVTDPAQPGVRWLSVGYTPTGSVATAAVVTSGSLVRWPAYQTRQQTPKITVGGPGRIQWQWEKQFSVRVATNSSVASGAPLIYGDRPRPNAVYPVTPTNGAYDFHFWGTNLQVKAVRIQPPADLTKAPAKLRAQYWNGSAYIFAADITVPTLTAGTPVEINVAPGTNYSWAWRIVAVDSSDTEVPPVLSLCEISRVAYAAGSGISSLQGGSGEFWFQPGTTVTAYAPGNVSSGISNLTLKGYTSGQGSVKPYAAPGVITKSFILTESSSITWDYARAIYPETVAIGGSISFSGVTGVDVGNTNRTKPPSGGSVSIAPSGSAWADMQQWDQVAKKLIVLRPGKFTVEFENTAAATDPAQNVIVEVNAVWPTPDYTHIMEAPAVDLDPSPSDSRAFIRLAYSEGTGQVAGGLFSTTEPGRSVLVYTQRTGGTATGNIGLEPLDVKVVNSLHWASSALATGAYNVPATIGSEITSADQDTAAVGHNGYVLSALAPVNTAVYNPNTQLGPIIPVNENFPAAGRWKVGTNVESTHVLAGRIIDFKGPDDLLLNPDTVKIAVSFYGDSDRVVNGVTFQTDGQSSFFGGIVTANGVTAQTLGANAINNFDDFGGSAPALTGGTPGSAEALGEILRDIRYCFPNQLVGATITGLNPGQTYNLQFLTCEPSGNRRVHDIAVNGMLLVDNYTSNGHSNGPGYSASTAHAYSVELVAPSDGKLIVGFSSQFSFGANPPPPGSDNNPILSALIVHSVGSIAAAATTAHNEPGSMAVAWYKNQDGINWPWQATRYVPQWPTAGRIVTASQLGSEGMNNSGTTDGPGGALTYSGTLTNTQPLWLRPASDLASVTSLNTRYAAIPVIPTNDNNPLWFISSAWSALLFVYEGNFDPAQPLVNLIRSATTSGNWANAGALRAGKFYTLVVSQDQPTGSMGTFSVDLQGGANVLSPQQPFSGPAFSDPIVYHQSDPNALGYNPNEEHSLIAPSFLDPARPAAFALRNDLNSTALDGTFTSKPYTLVQYTDKTNPANPVIRMAAYSVTDEDNATVDPRLPAFNQRYTYLYQGEAGHRLAPPYPLERVIGPSSTPEETEGENVNGRIAYHEDKKNNPWIVSGDTDLAEDIRAIFYYPVRADFWHPTKAMGEVVPLRNLADTRPYNIYYNTIWPANAAVLKAGETLTFSGGEYASDGGPGVALAPVIKPSDPVLPSTVNELNYGSATGPEGADKAIDGLPNTKYLNFGRAGTGLMVTPSTGATIVRRLSLTSANDVSGRDPASYVLQGSNLPNPAQHGWSADWTSITQGAVSFSARFQTQSFFFTNATAYTSYRIIFASLADPYGANSMQVAEFQLEALPAASGAATPVFGLPGAVAWQCGKLLFDSANDNLNPSITSTKYLGRVFPALESTTVSLALQDLPTELQPASGNVIVEGLLWRFKKLPASLQKRIYYDASTQQLAVRGLLNDRVLGDSDLLATPGSQTILQPNVLTATDQAIVADLSSNSNWTSAVTVLGTRSRNPLNAPVTTGALGIGLTAANGGSLPATSFGPGLAVITNPDLLDPGTSATLADGYISIAENDDPILGDAPVAIHIIKVSRTKYRGSIAVLAPENAFDEKLSLRHTADFGGDVSKLYFEWVYREEDGRDLNPPNIPLPISGTPTSADWTTFTGGGLGKSEIQMSGASAAMLTDNVFYCRYRHANDPDGLNWSAWAGAANSREPKLNSPTVDVDAAYVAQLAPGWVKRVTNAVNQFDARIKDFRNNNAPATYTSMIQQAGQRWEGPVAFNPQKDAIEHFGLIELYQTVLDRGKLLSIDTLPGTDGVNTALLNAANRIAGLYTLMGNEAFADALDPTVGYSTVSGQYGNLAPTIHCFQNQTGNLLEEELALLRGRSEIGARPAYNRMLWNFTNGQGEAAYALNYAIGDLNNDGFINETDARRLYPQGHGDAWGHYTMALKGYYDLAKLANFTWSSRSEKYLIEGVVLDVDYLDERMFAKTAAVRAQCGAAMVDLAYRQAYTENPNGQWQGYRDTNVDRAWGVFETSQRAGTAALCDWLMASSMLKAEETDTAKTGIRKVDRTTVGELKLIAQQASSIQAKLNSADHGMNPAGLDPEAVPFDIDPVLTDRTNPNAATHFEQIYQRALGAGKNALLSFNNASDKGLQLRRTAASTESLRQQTIDQDRTYRNKLIEIFGTPYAGQIGAGKAYPAGYSGPDLYLFMYMDRVSAGGDVLPELSGQMVATTIVPGLRNLASDTNPFTAGNASAADLLKDTVSNYFPNDVPLPASTVAPINLNLPRQASGYALVAPDGWGARRSPGAIQASVQDLIHAEWKLRMALDAYEGTTDDFKLLLRKFELKSGIAAEKLRVSQYSQDQQLMFDAEATRLYTASASLTLIRDGATKIIDALAEGMPKVLGLANDGTAPARGLLRGIDAAQFIALGAIITGLEVSQYKAELNSAHAALLLEHQLLTEDLKSEIVDLLAEIQQLVNDEGDLRVAVIDAVETMRASSERVRTVTEQGLELIEDRTVFNQRVASTTTKMRYEDYTFRVFHTEALRKYQSSFDLASRYAYLAGKAYQYELNLPDNHAANASPLLAEMLRTRTLGEWDGGQPVLGQGGIGEQLAILKTNFDTLKGQLGFNNTTPEVNNFSVRAELARIGLSSRVNAAWRTQLETYRVPDLWNYQYQNNGVNYGYVFRRYCRPFAPEAAGAQPALVVPFTSQIAAGKNWFGLNLAGGDSAFNASNFSTKIRAAGVRFDGYNNTAMGQTPQVYFIPVGADRMFLPNSNVLADRAWNVVDQQIPAPLNITQSNLNDPDWMPYTGSGSGFFEDIRKFSSFRAYHDAGGYSAPEMLSTGRLVGRSVWNTQWVLIIPSASLLNEPTDLDAGLDTFIYGAPLPGFTQGNAGTTNRDMVGVRDIRLLLQTYSISGN